MAEVIPNVGALVISLDFEPRWMLANHVVFNALPAVDQGMAATLEDRSVGILTYGRKLFLPLLAVNSVALSMAPLLAWRGW